VPAIDDGANRRSRGRPVERGKGKVDGGREPSAVPSATRSRRTRPRSTDAASPFGRPDAGFPRPSDGVPDPAVGAAVVPATRVSPPAVDGVAGVPQAATAGAAGVPPPVVDPAKAGVDTPSTATIGTEPARNGVLQGPPRIPQADWLTRSMVARRLGKSESTIRRWDGVRLHPVVGPDGVNRYDPVEVEALAPVLSSGDGGRRAATTVAATVAPSGRATTSAQSAAAEGATAPETRVSLIFADIRAGKALVDIVIERAVSPDAVEAIHARYLRLNGIDFDVRAVGERVDALERAQGEFRARLDAESRYAQDVDVRVRRLEQIIVDATAERPPPVVHCARCRVAHRLGIDICPT